MFDRSARYYVGDLSVVLTEQEVMHLKQFKDGFCSLPNGVTIYKKTIENGVYRTSLGTSLSVSIGLIGVVPMLESFNTTAHTRQINLYGMNHFFQAPFGVTIGNKEIKIGDITIYSDHIFEGAPSSLAQDESNTEERIKQY